MSEEYKPEFLNRRQKQFIYRHRKALIILFASIGFFLVILLIAPYVIDYIDIKNKEITISRIANQLRVDVPGEWREDQRCERNSEKFKALPPTCHVGVSAVFEVKSNEELRKIIDSVQRSLDGDNNIFFHESMDNGAIYRDLLEKTSIREKESADGEFEVSSSRTFKVKWAPDGRCSVIFRIKNNGMNEDMRLIVYVGCNKDSRFAYYGISVY